MKQQNPTYPLRMPKSLKSEAARCLLKQAGGLEPEPQDRRMKGLVRPLTPAMLRGLNVTRRQSMVHERNQNMGQAKRRPPSCRAKGTGP